ncbi:hypothetical protein BMF94_1518 [Rhodotorula taiwanensis]|uniref:Uncharacterized protein n=1 Tax=Rhodotorula taiwanensis TaxID=741276 RepID=A0A2S5BF96_9BASI|nr:hypothetical protein BMF94_1518 [Rhodotorula taiwanensis]
MAGPPPPVSPRPVAAESSREVQAPRPHRPPVGPPAYPPTALLGPLIADGKAAQSGVLVQGVKWQASGILEDAANMPGQVAYIERPLTIHLGGPTQCIDDKGRQRTEILSWPPSAPGETWSYTWKFHLHPDLPTSSKFFHLMQLFSREQKGWVVALGLVQNKVRISSQLPPLLGGSDGTTPVPLPEIGADRYWGRTTRHYMLVTYGPNGAVDYSISDAVTNELLLRYCMQNVPVPAAGTIKTGLYRQHVCSPASAVVGDFDFRRTG